MTESSDCLDTRCHPEGQFLTTTLCNACVNNLDLVIVLVSLFPPRGLFPVHENRGKMHLSYRVFAPMHT